MASNNLKLQFEVPGRFRMISLVLMLIGALALIIGLLVYGTGENANRFWGPLLYNSLYFLMICNSSMFFICATTLAFGGWQTSFRRVPEAISSVVPYLGALAFIVLMILVFGGKHVYQWTDHAVVQSDRALKGKSGFLNPTFFTIWTVL